MNTSELHQPAIEVSTELSPSEMTDKLYEFMDSRRGATLSAASLYSGVFEEAYDPSNAEARKNRVYLQLMFNPNHSFGTRFYDMALSQGKAVQVGSMYLDRDDPEARKKQKRVYRLHDATAYNPNKHESTEFRDTFFVEWEPAVLDVEINPRIIPEFISVEGLAKQASRPRKKTARKVEPAADNVKPAKENKQPSWEPKFAQAVKDTIIQKEVENLMIEGDIPANAIRNQTVSAIVGTETNRQRLYAAGLINREQLSVDAPLSPQQLVLAALINPNRKLLGQRNKAQKRAVSIVETEVNNFFLERAD